jgi:hypothetical protein
LALKEARKECTILYTPKAKMIKRKLETMGFLSLESILLYECLGKDLEYGYWRWKISTQISRVFQRPDDSHRGYESRFISIQINPPTTPFILTRQTIQLYLLCNYIKEIRALINTMNPFQ